MCGVERFQRRAATVERVGQQVPVRRLDLLDRGAHHPRDLEGGDPGRDREAGERVWMALRIVSGWHAATSAAGLVLRYDLRGATGECCIVAIILFCSVRFAHPMDGLQVAVYVRRVPQPLPRFLDRQRMLDEQRRVLTGSCSRLATRRPRARPVRRRPATLVG